MDVELSPKPEQLKLARENLGLTLGQAAKALKLSAETLAAWEAGIQTPDADELGDLADLYGRPVGYFFSPPAARPERQDFRLAATRQKPQDPIIRRVAVAEFEELCKARAILGARRGEERSDFIERLRRDVRGIEDPEAMSSRVREFADLGTGPAPALPDLLESWGVAVFLVNLPRGLAKENLAGTSWWHPDYGPAVLINRGDSPGRRKFTLAHELAHLLRLEVQPICDLNDAVGEERFANRFAATLLMPEADLIEFASRLEAAGELRGEDTQRGAIAKIATRYGTGVEATSFRLEELGFLPAGYTSAHRDELGREFFGPAKGKRWRKAVRDLGSDYLVSVKQAYERGELSLSAVADLLHVDIEQAMEWVGGSE